MTVQNGVVGAAAPAPQLIVGAQYVKDQSFENKNAPQSLAPQARPPDISIHVNVSANQLDPTEFEVSLAIAGSAGEAPNLLFKFELDYAGVFRLKDFPQPNLHPTLMIECPRLLFPYAREVVSNMVRDGGFPPLMMDPIDFVALYRQRLDEEMAKQAVSH